MGSYKNADLELNQAGFRANKKKQHLTYMKGTVHNEFRCNLGLQDNEERAMC